MKNTCTNTIALLGLTTALAGFAPHTASADIVHLDDVIIDGSLCAGFDCVNGESFGFDTLRLKENNLRVHFQDTSAAASFPGNDWRIIINDSGNGGGSYFGIEDSTAGRISFRVEAGAPTNALYVEGDGDIGVGTSNPAVRMHIVKGDSPTVRLEQDGSAGFTPQTWDIAGNETNFFVRDVTNGSKLPFRIRPNAPGNSIYVDADGDVGMGTATPAANLHIRRGGASFATLRLDAPSAAPNTTADITFTDGGAEGSVRINIGDADAQEFEINHNGNMTITSSESFNSLRIVANGASPNTAVDLTYTDAGASGSFRINIDDGDNQELELDNAGNMTIDGTLTQNSDKTRKMAIVPVDSDAILLKVAALPVSSWTYKDDADTGIRHIGPMAQDFFALFGTGRDEKGISSIDTGGVALAAIQALSAENADLRSRLDRLEALLTEQK